MKTLLKSVLKWCLIVGFFPFSLLYLLSLKKRREYEETAYFSATQIPYNCIRRRAGVRGEYLLYKELCFLEEIGAKFLFNAYIPKLDGTTTELDLICVCSRGIFVFESKDYSGWIFGSENQKEWMQTHSSRRSAGGVHKQRFYNPVMQNQTHIRYLRSFLRLGMDFPIWSVVVFSNHCELKKIEVRSKHVFVTQQYQVKSLIKDVMTNTVDVLSDHEIESIYQLLYPLTQVSEEVKRKHNADVSEFNKTETNDAQRSRTMSLIGVKVNHATFGQGVISEQRGKYITVQFATRSVPFAYPEAFDKFIQAEDAEIRAFIMKDIEEAKAAAKRQREAEEAARRATEGRRQEADKPTSAKVKKTKSIDEMFSEDYHAENLVRHPILTYGQVEKQFGIKIAGFGRGINPTDRTVVLISSIGKANGNFVYHDKWTIGGDYIYSGEGKTGNQTMTKGNLAIKNAARDGKKIHLFVKFSPQEYYYQGIFELVSYTYEDEKDENGNIRKEYKFRLKKVVNG